MSRHAAALPSLILVLFLPLVAGACATGGAAGSQEETTVIVENNLVPREALSIYALSDFGGRRLVGHVSPGATEALTFRASAGTQEYRFVAQTTAGREVASNPLTFTPGATLRWSLSANIATVQERGRD